MQRLLTWIGICLAVLGMSVSLNAAGVQPRQGVMRVKLSQDAVNEVGTATRKCAPGKQLRTGLSALDKTVRQVGGISIRPMLPPNPRFAAARAKYGLDRWYVISYDETIDPQKARRIVGATKGIEAAEVITPMVLKEGNGKFVEAKSAPHKAVAEMPFNDPRLPDQWHYKNFGNIPYTIVGADINLFDAWKTETGKKDVLVAIIDGGVDYTHEDLARHMWVNEAELNGQPGVDDDGNGYVDDVHGYNFCTGEATIYPHTHGTHVAGTVGAVNNNGIGVAGVAGGDGTADSGVRMISCQVFDSRSGAGDGDFAAALVYAAEMGATIAQCSWGWEGDGYYEQPVLDAIDYFTETARSDRMSGGLCFFATGNSGAQGKFYPAAYPKVVAVAAMTGEFTPASYSNCGDWVDIVAPGGLMDYGEAQGVLSTLPNNKYGYNEGTSMATPHVSGIAALILSKYGNKNFVNETLRTQIVSSVNDFYGHGSNSGYAGLFGSGYVDATKALRMDTDGVPAAISTFTLTPAQDNITVSFVLPESTDNAVNNVIVYYSIEPITAGNIDNARQKVVDTKFSNPGETVTAEITNLAPLTTYYVALRAVNRWGKGSDLSEMKSATTNAGPQMTLSGNMLSLDANAANPVASGTFTIGNTADGLLKWSSAKSTVSASLLAMTRPTVGNTAAYSGKLAGNTIRRAASSVSSEYLADDYPVLINYYDYLWANIGDTDRTLPNSMAQWFKVDATAYPDGFNLTSLNIEGANGTNPVIEIYRGDQTISQASLIQRVSYSYFVYGYPVTLQEQIYFAPGESFWVAVHFEGNQENYPLGLGYAENGAPANYSYMSNDMGKTWTLLSAALKGSSYESNAANFSWAITARSTNPDWSSVMELNPSEGTVLPGETQDVVASVDGTKLVNGTYKFAVGFKTNESTANTQKVDVTLNVADNQPDVTVPKVVDFGNLLVGQSKTVSVEVFNKGYGSFRGSMWGAGIYADNISVSNANFRGPEYITSGFPARAKTSFDLTFAPVEAGTQSGTVTFKDANGNEVRILVQGTATQPAVMSVDPSVIDAGTLTVGDEPVEHKFTVKNDGAYPLEFVFPKFSDETIDGLTSKPHQFGYTIASTLDGYDEFAYDGNPAVTGATDVTGSFSDSEYYSEPIAIGFEFPYYGKRYENLYITSYGGVMFSKPEDGLWPPLTEKTTGLQGIGYIAAYGNQLQMNKDSHVTYAHRDGKFVVTYTNVLACVYDTDYTPISFHLTLAPNGDIEIFYDDYTAEGVFQSGSTLFCGINDPGLEDVLTVTSSDMADYWGNDEPTADNTRFRSINSGTAVRFEAPKDLFVTALTPAYGLVAPGESVEVTATLAANDKLNAGATSNRLTVLCNDPAPAVSSVTFNAVIAGEGLVAAPVIEKNNVDFGSVFRTSDLVIPVTVKNAGQDAMEITAASADNDSFTVTNTFPITVAAGSSCDINVKVDTQTEGARAATLSVTTSAGVLSASISGTVIGVPSADLNIESIVETVESGTPLAKELTLTNNGNEDLVYTVTSSDATVAVPEKDESTVSYTWTSTVDDKTPYEWVDIETNGLGTQNSFAYYNAHDYVAVDLPFEFKFYGKKYNKMYIYNTGFISFTERRDDRIWPEPPADFPAGTVFTNIIAPYWGLHSMNTTKTAGTFHYVTDDRAVVSFIEYGNSMNIGVCYQVILEKDGSFKFQYKGADENAIIFSPFGLAGISNTDGSQSIRLPERQMAFNNAVRFAPVIENTLHPGQTDVMPVTLNTARMAGQYDSEIAVSTNVPGHEKIEIPVQLTITGTAKPVFPEVIEVEHVMAYQSTDYENPLVQMGACYDAAFNVVNEGTAPFTILNIINNGPTVEDEYFGDVYPMFNIFAYMQARDGWTGELLDEYSWMQYDNSPMEVGSTPAQFSIPMLQSEQWMTPGTYEIPLTFQYALSEADYEEPLTATTTVRFIVTPMPSMVLDKESIEVSNAADDHSSVETLTISNYGEYKLTYDLYLDPTGQGEEPVESGGGIAPWSITKPVTTFSESLGALLAGRITPKLTTFAASNHVFNVPSDFNFTNALYYDVMPDNNSAYNYGAGTLYDTFKAAVAFKAPAEGFNMSHIYLPVYLAGAENVTIRLNIVQGTDPDGETVLGKGRLFIEKQQSLTSGSFYVIPLDKPVYLNGNEEFTVVVEYPAGLQNPTYVCVKEEPVETGRYLGWTEAAGWFDLGELFKDTYGSLGYVLSCLETQKGEPWVKLVDTSVSGEIAPGETAAVNVAVNAAAARMEKGNKAMIVIKTNDPNAALVNFPVYLNLNGTPVISGAPDVITVAEGTPEQVVFSVSDPDADAMSISISGHTLASVKAVEGGVQNEDGTWSIPEGTASAQVTVEVAADYGDAGTAMSFTLTAADTRNHSADHTVTFAVTHTNRAPVAVDVVPVAVGLDKLSEVVSFAKYFTDPDNDDLTYSFTLPETDIVEAYTTSTGVVFRGLKEGTVKAVVTAADAAGLTTDAEMTVVVSKDSGVNDITSDDANALATVVNAIGIGDIHMISHITGRLHIATYSLNGVQLSGTEADVVEGQSLNVAAGTGVTLLTVSCGDAHETHRVLR